MSLVSSCESIQGYTLTEDNYSLVVEFLREGTFFIGGGGGGGGGEGVRGGPGYFRIFLRKKSWPSHFLEWINA